MFNNKNKNGEFNSKNFPKTLGNCFFQYIEKQDFQNCEGIKNFKDERI